MSARIAGIDRTTHYEWRAKDSKYRAAFERTLRFAADLFVDKLVDLARTGVFTPLIYKGRLCYARRIRIICQLADGTSAFQDELPKGAKVTSSRPVTTHDGKMLGRYKRSGRALMKLLAVWFPDEFGPAVRRKRKDPSVAASPFDIDPRLKLIGLCNRRALETNPASPAVFSNPGERSATSHLPSRASAVSCRKE